MKKNIGLLLVFTILPFLIVVSSVSISVGQQTKAENKVTLGPVFFKVYSKGGRESLTAWCKPTDSLSLSVQEVSCKIINVRFIPPNEKPNKPKNLLSVEDMLKNSPKLAEEVRENPKKLKKLEKLLRQQGEELKRNICSPSSKERVAIETKLLDPDIGPKRKSYFQKLIASCSNKDITAFFSHLSSLERQTCDLWVDSFTLEFKKIRDGQWLYRQETPGVLSHTIKIYELTSTDGALWKLSETRVPMEGSKEKTVRTVWSWENDSDYELPCDFISHGFVQFP